MADSGARKCFDMQRQGDQGCICVHDPGLEKVLGHSGQQFSIQIFNTARLKMAPYMMLLSSSVTLLVDGSAGQGSPSGSFSGGVKV